MPPPSIFILQLVLGYVAWLLCYRAYLWPRLKKMHRVDAHRAIATLHSFRFFGLVFVVPGVVGPHLPESFARLAAYADLATGALAILALLAARRRPLFWLLVVAFNVVGMADLLVDYYHAVNAHLPEAAGELGAAYAIPVIYVPLLMITHVTAFYMLARPRARPASLGVAPGAAA
jgi:nicotinamide riboside transporter PnuC